MADEDLLRLFVAPLNEANIDYVVTGAVAAIVYGTPRVTEDIDIIIDMKGLGASDLEKLFPPSAYYVPPAEVIASEAMKPTRGHFDVIHMSTGLKADFYLAGRDPLHKWAMERRKTIQVGRVKCAVAPPEYVIIRKLEYFLEGGSEKHLEDIRRMMEVSGATIDMSYLDREIRGRGLEAVWKRAVGQRDAGTASCQ